MAAGAEAAEHFSPLPTMTETPPTDDEGPDETAGRWLFAQRCTFVRGVVDMAALPPADRLEVAFAGRSNVGKSSLINALTGRKALARTSNTPGRTQEINFFVLGPEHSQGLYLVDLPGYGYARESKARVAAWTRLVMAYLQGRPSLRRVLLLIDARHGLKANDTEVIRILDKAAVSYQVVLTKTDKLKPAELERRTDEVAAALKAHPAAHPEIVATSSNKGAGIDALRARIAALADLEALGYKPRTE